MTTTRIEDYLKEIFLLENTGRNVTITDVAERLKINRSCVTVMVQKLVQAKMLHHERYGSLHLTVEGRQRGFLVYRRYEGLRAFFHELLGIDRNHSSKIACSMEHYIDSGTGDKLDALLEFFRRARADREPWVDEFFNAMEAQVFLPNPLSLLEDGQEGCVAYLTADPKLRDHLQNKGFKTGARVTCLDTSATGYLLVSLNGKHLAIPRNEATAIWLRMA
jgi:DtxR family Mn-dependent transcriptional regulator